MGITSKINKAAGEQTEGQMYSTHSPGFHSPQSCTPLKFQSVPSDSGTCPNTQSTAAERHREMNTTASVAAEAKIFNLWFITGVLAWFQTTKSAPTSQILASSNIFIDHMKLFTPHD